MVSIEYLETERKKIWEEIVELKKQIEKKTSDYENEAKQASKKCTEFKNKCDQSKTDSSLILESIKAIESQIKQTDLIQHIAEIKEFYQTITLRREELTTNIAQLDSLFSQYVSYAEKIKKLDDLATSADDTSLKIEAIFKQLNTRKKEIDEFYYGIFGYTGTDEAGSITTITGAKEELEKTYNDLKANFEAFSQKTTLDFSAKLDQWSIEYTSALNKIQSLLPNALTTGLSYAYSAKKKNEEDESKRFDFQFKLSVGGLFLISLIPFAVSVYFLVTGLSLDQAILKMPRLILSILPLYIPVLWLAYSANKKLNLSKRLIEEYTHKEVISKTFEGLSNQIQDIKDEKVSSDLRTRLLYNMLEVSSENPGKLISDYNKSDHPLMEALDKSVKLTNAIEHLAKIPGMTKLVKVLETKAETIIEKEDKKASAGIEVVDQK